MNSKKMRNQQYRLVGNHSAVKVCHWVKKSLTDEGFCYKQKFYGIESHRCCQMTPSLFCPNRCVFCWRSEETITKPFKDADDPEKIVDGCIEKQRELINGFPGNEKVNMKKFKEAQDPTMFAISLTGEPTVYPKIDELIHVLKKRGIKSFLVTNGLFPEVLEKLTNLPTQLYVSMDAPTKELYKKIDRPLMDDYWERFNKTLEIISGMKTRTVIRITAVKGINMTKPEQYVKLIQKANPTFVEVKGYMWVGDSRKRLNEENMPSHEDVRQFAKDISDILGWKIIDEKKESTAILIAKEDSR